MRKKGWVWFILFILATLLFIGSCTKTKELTSAETEANAIAAQEAEKARLEEEARLRELEEQRIREEREAQIREERIKAEAEENARSAARENFSSENIYFEFDSSVLAPEAESVLRDKAQWLMDNPDISVIIEGHCDERGTNEYNLALGDKRAGSVKTYLINLGIDGSRLTVISYGEERPADPSHNEDAWAKNRRVHFEIN